MASLCAAVWPKPISLIPCLSWTTASVVFVDGIMSMAVDWKTLTEQYFSDSIYCDRIRSMIQPSVPDCYRYLPPPPETPTPASSGHPLHDSAPGSPTHVNVPQLHTPTADTSTETHLPPHQHVLPESPVVDNHRDLSVGPSTQSTDAELTTPTSVQSELARTLLFYDLAFLKRLQPTGLWSSWNLPDSLRRPFDSSLWHIGFSMLRSWPEGLVTGFSPPDPEVSQFLRDLLDFFTHLGNFPPLADPRLLLAVTAEQDAYVPRHGVVPLNQLYLGSEIRFLPQSGHVGAYLRNAVWTVDFRRAIVDCLNRQIELHHGETGPFGASQTSPFVKRKR
ncbi:unnamed protein product [Dicrocoelium dendriticum]|nr:unnamed protein product [Dicrocoelium dendriticum]